jgi:uncharacterized protein (DUF58 family)
VALAASVAAQALGEGRAVGLRADDGQRRVVTPGRGPRQLWRILGELVDAQATGALPLAELVRQGRAAQGAEMAGAGLAVVTPDTSGGWLAALADWQRGRPGGCLALLVTTDGTPALASAQALEARPASINAATNAPAGILALEARLAELGVPAYQFEVGRPLALLNPPKPKPVTRVSPLGRVVRG